MKRRNFVAAALGAAFLPGRYLVAEELIRRPIPPVKSVPYREAIRKTAAMVSDGKAQSLARKHGLQVLNVTWEDTGRYKDSSVGPNISDMTIQVAASAPKSKKQEVTCMPVIRHPNFSDKSCDLDPRDFTLLVGNQKGKEALKRISLYEFLENPTDYLHDANSWKESGNESGKKEEEKPSLLCDRDGKILVSAQACFLPVPKKGKATFNPVLFNYQSYAGDPAVLTVLATREGTSVTVIDNKRDAFASGAVWGQRLFHNADGERASLTGERQSEFIAKNPGGGGKDSPGVGGKQSPGKVEKGLNMVLLIQVPLKQKKPMTFAPTFADSLALQSAAGAPGSALKRTKSNVENAVIGHGDLEGKYTEVDNLSIERDERFPVRVTVQFYKATDNGVVSEEDMSSIARQINRVYEKSDYVGSLVCGGETGRVTEYDGIKVQPPDWWAQFWKRHQENTGDSPEVAMRKLMKLLGQDFQERAVCELYLRDVLGKN